MTVEIKELTESERDDLRVYVKSRYLGRHGRNSFAIALHRGLGYEIVGVMRHGFLEHVGVCFEKNEKMVYLDVRGELDEEGFVSVCVRGHHRMSEVSEEDLLLDPQVTNETIRQALQDARMLFPEKVWILDLDERQREFVKKLQALSEEYGVWVGGSVANAPAILYPAKNSVVGQFTYTASRYLGSRVVPHLEGTLKLVRCTKSTEE